MIEYERTIQALGATLRQRSWLSPGVRIFELETRGVRWDQGLLAWETPSARAHVNVVCEGTLTARRGGEVFVVRAGQVFMETGGLVDECLAGEPFRAWCVDWPATQEGRREVRDLTESGLAQLSTSPVGFEEIVALLKDQGLWGAPEGALEMPVSVELQRITKIYGELLSNLHDQPMWCDFVERVGMSERQLRRHLSGLLGAFPMPSGEVTFRETLASMRMLLGLALMTAPEASVGEVARVLGYSSSVAYTNACKRAGLGAPSTFMHQTERRWPSP